MCAQALVWFKKDLRVQDHAPLAAAAGCETALPLYVIEPEALASPECAAQHWAFTRAALQRLRGELARLGLPLWIEQGPLPEVLERLHRRWRFSHLFSHEETGSGWSYARDLAVGGWCRSRGVLWQEFAQTGVVRRLRSRAGWAARWQQRMDAPLIAVPAGLRPPDEPTLREGRPWPLAISPAHPPLPEPDPQPLLSSFLTERGAGYRSGLSSPLTAGHSCSRLSAHLAFGTISLRQVHQATEAQIARLKDHGGPTASRHAHALRGFAGRLRWHCHFMQKLEDEPRIEFENFARVYDGLRASDPQRLAAWAEGRSGFPMVDACMRALAATGWLNFRMRAMLVSFAAYQLWLDWRAPGLHLARLFLDFEPGIHWSQMQMQSGTTGINTLRIYSPTKQAQDQDPQGLFLRRWLPELAGVPTAWLATPWLMSPAQQRAAGCRIGSDYPAPIVDERAALAEAKRQLYGLRQTQEARQEAAAIQQRHGSRKSGLPPGQAARRRARPEPAAAAQQLDLFDAAAQTRSAPEDAHETR